MINTIDIDECKFQYLQKISKGQIRGMYIHRPVPVRNRCTGN